MVEDVAAARRARAREEIVRLVHRTSGVHRLGRDVTRVLERAVPFDGISLLTSDPATLLPTSGVVENGLGRKMLPQLIEIGLREPDFNKFRAMARRGRRAARLSEATRGDLAQSLRHREVLRPSGFDDELRVACMDSTGAWGALTLLRECGRPVFDDSEVGFLASLAPLLADGLRRAAILDEVGTGDHCATGVVVLAPDNSVEMATPGAQDWLADLVAGDTSGAELPIAVHAVAARARRIASDYQNDLDRPESRSDTFARARVRSAHGSWVTVRGSVLGDGPDCSVAVLMEEAHPPELAPLIADAYGLTDRERRVTELVAQGFSTNDIGQRLHLSAYTVQDHLKSIFDKTGAGSRGEVAPACSSTITHRVCKPPSRTEAVVAYIRRGVAVRWSTARHRLNRQSLRHGRACCSERRWSPSSCRSGDPAVVGDRAFTFRCA
jgi:DNA-binding NarL/FixJ family response regulator